MTWTFLFCERESTPTSPPPPPNRVREAPGASTSCSPKRVSITETCSCGKQTANLLICCLISNIPVYVAFRPHRRSLPLLCHSQMVGMETWHSEQHLALVPWHMLSFWWADPRGAAGLPPPVVFKPLWKIRRFFEVISRH